MATPIRYGTAKLRHRLEVWRHCWKTSLLLWLVGLSVGFRERAFVHETVAYPLYLKASIRQGRKIHLREFDSRFNRPWLKR